MAVRHEFVVLIGLGDLEVFGVGQGLEVVAGRPVVGLAGLMVAAPSAECTRVVPLWMR